MTPSSYLNSNATPVLSSPAAEAGHEEIMSTSYFTVSPKSSSTAEYQAGTSVVKTSNLYDSSGDSGQMLALALRLLNRGYAILCDAYESSSNGDPVLADLKMMELQESAESLFQYRSISATFGMIVTALGSAITSQKGSLFTTDQILELRGCFAVLRSEPFLKDERALGLVERLEAVGLDPISPDYKEFALIADER